MILAKSSRLKTVLPVISNFSTVMVWGVSSNGTCSGLGGVVVGGGSNSSGGGRREGGGGSGNGWVEGGSFCRRRVGGELGVWARCSFDGCVVLTTCACSRSTEIVLRIATKLKQCQY